MATAVISIAQQKGGVGKTTLAIQLGMAWHAAGKRVLMVDIDPQQSLSAWYALRCRLHGEPCDRLAVRTLTGWRLGSELSTLRAEADYILIDTPPHAETDTKNAIRLADLALLPIQPNVLDLWATSSTLDLAKAQGTKAILVMNRVPARSRAAEAVHAEIAATPWPMANATLGNRQVFAASLSDGRSVAETAATSMAGQEIARLTKEIPRHLR